MPKLTAVHRPFDGVTIIDRSPSGDHRGVFERLYCADELIEVTQGRTLSQVNRSTTHKKGVVRGLHYQEKPYAETKVITCLRGEVFDVAVDMRPDSPTYLHWFGIVLSEKKTSSIIIGEGFAHGFQTLSGDCEMLYFHTAPFNSEAERGIRPTDPAVGIKWPIEITDMSPRDAAHPLITLPK